MERSQPSQSSNLSRIEANAGAPVKPERTIEKKSKNKGVNPFPNDLGSIGTETTNQKNKAIANQAIQEINKKKGEEPDNSNSSQHLVMKAIVKNPKDQERYDRALLKDRMYDKRLKAAFQISDPHLKEVALKAIVDDSGKTEEDGINYGEIYNRYYSDILSLSDKSIQQKILKLIIYSATSINYCFECALALEDEVEKQKASLRIATDEDEYDDHPVDCFKSLLLYRLSRGDENTFKEICYQMALHPWEAVSDTCFNRLDIKLMAAILLCSKLKDSRFWPKADYKDIFEVCEKKSLLQDLKKLETFFEMSTGNSEDPYHEKQQEAFFRIAKKTPELPDDLPEDDGDIFCIFSRLNESCLQAANRLTDPAQREKAYIHIASLAKHPFEKSLDDVLYFQKAWLDAANKISDPGQKNNALLGIHNCKYNGYGLSHRLSYLKGLEKKSVEFQTELQFILSCDLAFHLENKIFFRVGDAVMQIFAYKNILDKNGYRGMFNAQSKTLGIHGISTASICCDMESLDDNTEMDAFSLMNTATRIFTTITSINVDLIKGLPFSELFLGCSSPLPRGFSKKLGVNFDDLAMIQFKPEIKRYVFLLDELSRIKDLSGLLEEIIQKMLQEENERISAASELPEEEKEAMKSIAQVMHMQSDPSKLSEDNKRILENYYQDKGLKAGILRFIEQKSLSDGERLLDYYLFFKGNSFLSNKEMEDTLYAETLTSKERLDLLRIMKAKTKEKIIPQIDYPLNHSNKIKNLLTIWYKENGIGLKESEQAESIPQSILKCFVSMTLERNYISQLMRVIENPYKKRFAGTKVAARGDHSEDSMQG